jgi:hypothetical protein
VNGPIPSDQGRIADLYANDARLTKLLERLQKRRRHVRAALRAFVPDYQGAGNTGPRSPKAQRLTAALVTALQDGPATVTELRTALTAAGVHMSRSKDPNVRWTNIHTRLARNPLLFVRSGNRWALR